MLFRVFLRLVAQTQLDRVQAELVRQLVHGAFDGQQANGFAGRAGRVRHRQVQRHTAVSRLAMGGGIERARGLGGRFVEIVKARRVRPRLMADRRQHAVTAGTQPQPLNGVAAVRGDMEHLLAGQSGLDRPVELARSHCRQQYIAINRQLAAKAATDVAADDAHLAGRYLQRVGNAFLRTFQQLGRAVDMHASVFPVSQAGMGLHLRVDVDRRGESCVNRDRRFCKSLVEVASRRVRALIALACRFGRLVQRRFQFKLASFLGIGDGNQPGSSARLLEGFSHDKSHGFAVVKNPVAAQLRLGAGKAVFHVHRSVGGLRRCILVSHHQQDAGRCFSEPGVKGGDAPLGNRGFKHVPVGWLAALMHFIGIGRLARDLQTAVGAVNGLADQPATVLVQGIGLGRLVHFHVSNLSIRSARPAAPWPPAHAAPGES